MMNVECNKCNDRIDEDEVFIIIRVHLIDLNYGRITEYKNVHLHQKCWEELGLL